MRLPDRSKVLVAAIAVLGVLLCLEVGLRTIDRVQGHSFWNTHGNVLKDGFRTVIPFRTFGYDPYVEIDGETWISDRWERRFPVDKPPGTIRIVCLGGSTTAQDIDGQHYPALLQDELRRRTGRDDVEVINAANSAYATPHSIILLALDVVSWQPDLVILSHNVNDLGAMYFPGFRPDYHNKYGDPYYSLPDYGERYTWTNVLFQHSRLYWFVIHRIENLRTGDRYRLPKLRRAPYEPRRVSEAEAIFRRNLETFVAIADANGIEVLLGTQPLEPSEESFVLHMAEKPYNDVVVYPTHDEFLAHHDAYNQTIREVAAATGAGLVDNARAFAGDPRLFIDHVHYTESGLRRLADSYADAILDANPEGG